MEESRWLRFDRAEYDVDRRARESFQGICIADEDDAIQKGFQPEAQLLFLDFFVGYLK